MDSRTVREKFLKFFESKGHTILPSSSLVPEGDPSVLFTTAGMQQFKPYYTAPEAALRDFGTKNVTTIQKCVRTSDIDEAGDSTHCTFLEMLGNFSFGGYGRKEAIIYAHDFITKELGLEISYVTFYKGQGVVPRDEESRKIWEELGVKDIREDGSDVFWGPTGNEGPCGPTTEIYLKNGKGEDVEIWNIVFNEYFSNGSREKLDKGEASLRKLDVLGIDTGMGLERLLATVQKVESVYDTDLFNGEKSKEERIVADHTRTALFLCSDGVKPGNTGAGYVLRRLIRRAVRFSKEPLSEKISKIKNTYLNTYKLDDHGEIEKEEKKFRETLEKGMKEFEKGTDPFILFTTYGFPIELTTELAAEKNLVINRDDFDKKMVEHQKLSQTSSAGMFKGGLANHEEKTVKLHTAHHLLLAALQNIVDKNIKQRGSNINEERLRIDFLCDHKLTDEEKKKVEDWVNDKIERKLNVVKREMPLEEAEKIGAEMEFGAKYPSVVSLYFIEDEKGEPISKEFCGGPHVANTSELGKFKIQKEEAVSAGVRRIKAVLV
jgi:alanyl-tRNA synthetase